MRKYFSIILAAVLICSACHSEAAFFRSNNFRESVVKIYVAVQNENYLMPWQPANLNSGNGSGFVIRGKKILTNAHVVSDAKFIEVQREGQSRRFQAQVLFVGHDCDLAVLTVADQDFFENTVPMEFGVALPDLNDEVIALGYPMGGQRLSLTKGVVSRIDYNLYTHSQVDSHLVMQIDAAINPGNSGGPVLFKDRVIGVAFQGIHNAQNLGYAIPLPVIEHFLKDIEDGVYHGYPELGVTHMETTNPALRRELGLPNMESGVVVDFVDPFGSAEGILKTGDVLLAIDGTPIAKDGTVRLNNQTLEYIELLERKQCGESIVFQVWRNGQTEKITVPLLNKPDPFIFRYGYDRQPEYFIQGGLVFTPLSRGLIANMSPNEIEKGDTHNLFYYFSFAKRDKLYADRTQFVVLLRRLPHPVNAYTDKYLPRIVSTINGVNIRSLKDLPDAFRQAKDKFHVIYFLDYPAPLILDAEAVARTEADILRRYHVPQSFHLSESEEMEVFCK